MSIPAGSPKEPDFQKPVSFHVSGKSNAPVNPVHPVTKAYRRLSQIFSGVESPKTSFEPAELTEKLMAAIESGSNAAVKVLLADPKINLNLIGKNGQTPLIHAMKSSNFRAVELLLSKADPNVKNNEGDTPLHVAVSLGSQVLIQKFIDDPRVNPNLKNKSGDTPVGLTVLFNRVNIIQQLISHPRIDLNIKAQDGMTLIQTAALRKNRDIVRLLLNDSRIDPQEHDMNGDTLLQSILRWEDLDLDFIQEILAHPRIDPNAANRDGTTPLANAILDSDFPNVILAHPGKEFSLLCSIHHSRKLVCDALIAHPRIDPNRANRDGTTPLGNVVLKNRTDLIKKLLAHPRIDPNLISGKELPLILSIRNFSEAMFNELMAHPRIDPNAANGDGTTPLGNAVTADRSGATIRKLLAHPRIDPNLISGKELPLILSIRKCNEYAFNALIGHHKFDPNLTNAEGDTYLHIAERESSYVKAETDSSSVKALLSIKNIDPTKKNRAGMTPLDIAIKKNDIDTVEVLLNHPKLLHLRDATMKKLATSEFLVFLAIRNPDPINKSLMEKIRTGPDRDLLAISELHNEGYCDIFKLLTSRGVVFGKGRTFSPDIRAFITEIRANKALYNRLSFALVSNPQIPPTAETVRRLARLHAEYPHAVDKDDENAPVDKLFVAIQGGATLAEIEGLAPMLGQDPPVTIQEWEQLPLNKQREWLNYCVVFRSRGGLSFAEEILKRTGQGLGSGFLKAPDYEFALAALRLIERLETTGHHRADFALLSEFESSVCVLLLDGLTKLIHKNNAGTKDLELLKQTFLTLSKMDTVQYNQRNLSALMQSLTLLTEDKNAGEIENLSDVICGLLQAMRHYGQFAGQIQSHPEWAQMILKLAEISETIRPKEVKQKLLFELGLTMSLIPDVNILQKAYTIVQGETWDHLSVGQAQSLAFEEGPTYDESQTYEEGGFELFTYRTPKHDLRENVSRRILDTLSVLLPLEEQTARAYQKYRDAPEAFHDVYQYEKWLLSIPMYGLRYMEPLYLPPSAPVFRGINARKGDNLLDEALFDLLKRGSGSAELTKVTATQGTWAKLGHSFTSLKLDYVTIGSFFNDGGALMVIKPEWVNEQVRIRQARNETEFGAFHYVFYQTIPLEAFSEIHVPVQIYNKMKALFQMPQFTRKELQKAKINLPKSPAEERDLFLLYKAVRENGKTLLPKLKAYQNAEDVQKVVPKEASFNDVAAENVRRFIGRKLAKQWLDKGIQGSL